jgi:hypothetical protein
MAKALLGHVGALDPRVIAEVRRLRERVQELEAMNLRLQAENDKLAAAVHPTDNLLTLEVTKEPALA